MKARFRILALVLCIAVMLPVCAYAQNDTLTLVTPPSRTDFYEGRDWSYVKGKIYPIGNLDISGTVVRYENETENVEIPFYVFPWGANMWCEPVSGTWKTGENEVYIFIDDVDGVYTTTTISLHPISQLTVAHYPTYTDYVRGIDWDYNSNGEITVEKIRLDGLALNILFDDGTTDTVAYSKKNETVGWTIPNDSFRFAPGKNTLSATYASKTAKFSVYLNYESIIKAYVNEQPYKFSYIYGEEWNYRRGRVSADIDLAGLTVTAEYNNGDSRTFAYDDEPQRFTVDDVQDYSPGSSYVNIHFDGEFPMYVNLWFEMIGDINFDGGINSTDALCVLKYVVGSATLDESEIMYADVNDDGIINSADALEILCRSVGLIDFFEAEI